MCQGCCVGPCAIASAVVCDGGLWVENGKDYNHACTLHSKCSAKPKSHVFGQLYLTVMVT